MQKLIISFFCVFFLAVLGLEAQEITSASSFFESVAERYAGIIDYSADVSMSVDDNKMFGRLIYRRPDRIRIDFSQPAKQVIVSDGDILQVHIPRYDVTLTQKLADAPQSAPGSMATQEGLTLMRRAYNIAYKSGPGTVFIDEDRGTGEKVTKLLLTWRNTNQGFRQLELSISSGKFIRRIDGITADRKNVRIDYSNIQINIGIASSRFDFDSPPTANKYDNFLFGTN